MVEVKLSQSLLDILAERPLAGQKKVEGASAIKAVRPLSRAEKGPLDAAGILMEGGMKSEDAGKLSVTIAEQARLYRREKGLDW